jgi:hypothetical protein
VEIGGGSRIVEKKRSGRRVEKRGECWSVEHLTVGSEVVIAFIIIFRV